MTGRLPRPADLLERLRSRGRLGDNQAVTRELLARPRPPRPPIVTVMESWIGLRRLAWFEIEGRRISGVATARRAGNHAAWHIDTLLGARPEAASDDAAVGRLLRRVVESAASERVGHVLLRTPAGGAAVGAALRAGFHHVSTERLWTGSGLRAAPGHDPGAVVVRTLGGEDAGELFRLHSAATPLAARRALGLTLAEWRALDGSRWMDGRGGRWVAELGGRPVAAARVMTQGRQGQLELIVESQAVGEPAGASLPPAREGREGGRALLTRAAEVTARCGRIVSLVPRSAVAVEELLSEHGFMPGREIELLVIRTRRLAVDPARREAGVAVASGG